MSKSVFITRAIPEVGLKLLRDKGYAVDVYPKDKVPKQKHLISYLKQKPYDAVMFMLTDTVDAAFFEAAPQAKLFAAYTVGYNNVDIAESKKRNLIVTNTSGSSQIAVAEHTIALMLGLTTRLVEADEYLRRGKYKGWKPDAFMGTDFSNKVIGLVGTGSIGAEVARMAHQGFGNPIIYHDMVRNEKLENEYKAQKCDSLEDVLKRADIVSLHVPLLDSTHHLINRERLALMKPTALLINTSRGPVVDEYALAEALKNKVIGGAGLDVFEFEPKIVPGLAKMKNVVVTPHIASARQSARDKMAEIAALNIIDYFEGRIPRNKVN